MQNCISITGRLTRDVELKQIHGGDVVTSISLACQRDYKDKETGEYPTDFIDCEVWRQSAEFLAKYAAKGDMLQVVGRLRIDDWMDKDGNKRRSAKVQANNAYIVSSKKNDSEGSQRGGNDNRGSYGGTNQNGTYGAGNGGSGYGYSGGGYGDKGGNYGNNMNNGHNQNNNQQTNQKQEENVEHYDSLIPDDDKNLPF